MKKQRLIDIKARNAEAIKKNSEGCLLHEAPSLFLYFLSIQKFNSGMIQVDNTVVI